MFARNGIFNLNDVDLNNLNAESTTVSSIPDNKNDTDIIKDMMELDEQFVFIMKKRIKGLEKISDSYKKGKYEESMAEAGLSKDLGVVNDFFRYALIKKDLNKIFLKSDMAIQIFPTILNMVNCKYDVYFKTGINTAWTILNLFSDPIMDALKTPLSGGIDLNREEKINKYKIIIDYFKKLRESPVLQNNLENNKIKNLNLKQFIGEVNFFINQCKKY
jgi:hypothetical protein